MLESILLIFVSGLLIFAGVCLFLIPSNSLLNLFFLGIASTCVVLFYLILNAPDVALTEVCVGVFVSGLFFLMSAKSLNFDTLQNRLFETGWRVKLAFALCLTILLFIFWLITVNLPPLGAFLNTFTDEYYLKNTLTQVRVPNVVTAILASYRGFDTMGETTIIALSALGVWYILHEDVKN
jgi:multicomponent Na+:H+ antiporter subunit B